MDFMLALNVTIYGLGIVFLALLVLMVAIMVWRPRGLVSTRRPTVFLKRAKVVPAEILEEGRV